jgi:AmmeMemoRadiSam system protein B
MFDASSRPALRSLETIVEPDSRHGRVLVLQDTHGFTTARAVLPPVLVPIVARMAGRHTCAEIAREATTELGADVPVELVVRLATELDEALLLDSARFRRERARVERAFADAAVRPAWHAGGAYEGERAKLVAYLDEKCLARARRKRGRRARDAKPHAHGGRVVGLIAPHIDPWRGAESYGHAYDALATALAPSVDTFVIFGTSHAPMREHFALCKKAFDTPLGAVPADDVAIDAIAARAPFDAYADQFNHRREHSLEFQVVFLKHLLGERPFTIVPVLAGLGEHQARRSDPAKDAHANAFLDAVRELVESRPGRVAVIAGADMAHVGPRFGDNAAFDASARRDLEATDRASLGHATARADGEFWEHVVRDLETRRVCGLGPIYALLRTLPRDARGDVLHYEQTIDGGDGSIVSHAAVAFYG